MFSGHESLGRVWTRPNELRANTRKFYFNMNLENWNNIHTINAVYDSRLAINK